MEGEKSPKRECETTRLWTVRERYWMRGGKKTFVPVSLASVSMLQKMWRTDKLPLAASFFAGVIRRAWLFYMLSPHFFPMRNDSTYSMCTDKKSTVTIVIRKNTNTQRFISPSPRYTYFPLFKVETVLDSELLFHWYAENPAFTHPKLTAIPLGLQMERLNTRGAGGRFAAFEAALRYSLHSLKK